MKKIPQMLIHVCQSVTLATLICCSSSAQAEIIEFVATGAAGEGLLEGNIDPATGEPGSGGIGLTGILFDTDTGIIHIDIEWGSANGYTDMSVDVLRVHLHGPTASAGTAAFGETAPLMLTLSSSASFNNSASGGGINDNFLLDPPEADALLQERAYINVHLSSTDTGMIRGYLIRAVPEPSTLLPLALLSLAGVRRRRR